MRSLINTSGVQSAQTVVSTTPISRFAGATMALHPIPIQPSCGTTADSLTPAAAVTLLTATRTAATLAARCTTARLWKTWHTSGRQPRGFSPNWEGPMIKQTTALSLQAHHAQAKVLYELVSGEAE